MARNSTKTADRTNAEVAYAPEETTVEPTTESTTAGTETTTPEAPVLTDDFKTAATTAADLRDVTLGDLPNQAYEIVQKAYNELGSVKIKNLAKEYLQENMKLAMTSGASDAMGLAKAFMFLHDSVVNQKKAAAPKEPTDPTQAFAEKVAGLRLALNLATSNVPDGVNGDTLEDRIQAAVESATDGANEAFLFATTDQAEGATAPEVSGIAAAAVKIALGRAPRSAGRPAGSVNAGPRRNVAAHVLSALEAAGGEFLTVNEIVNHTSEEYGTDHPSAGAVNARLFPSTGACSIQGVTPGQSAKGTRGASLA
jgi:hypothetical protein